MIRGLVQRPVMSFLNRCGPGEAWQETRAIANAVYESEWASQVEMARVRQALRILERDGEVARRGGWPLSFWRSTRRHLLNGQKPVSK